MEEKKREEKVNDVDDTNLNLLMKQWNNGVVEEKERIVQSKGCLKCNVENSGGGEVVVKSGTKYVCCVE